MARLEKALSALQLLLGSPCAKPRAVAPAVVRSRAQPTTPGTATVPPCPAAPGLPRPPVRAAPARFCRSPARRLRGGGRCPARSRKQVRARRPAGARPASLAATCGGGPGRKADGSLLAAGQKRQRTELYELGPQLGSGGFGTVFSGIRLSDGSPVAIKRVARESVLEWVELPDGTRVPLEVVLMEKVGSGCPNIIQLLDWFELPDSFVLCQHLIRWCLAKHPADRPELEEISRHPWVRGRRF
ncbi:hypothetical protein DV515_00017723 [Chloebia gouldiae]|uniref:non-specific serine/threonine protein kinase n=1 Tax=Chloebia gouldiae TaxID=44316 RepID=A0A3L8Q9H3_CHLGU|nr:hypothetical protein DV515_00017723 [Chloebia gouldiae]